MNLRFPYFVMKSRKLLAVLFAFSLLLGMASGTQFVERTGSSDDISVALERTPTNFIKLQVDDLMGGMLYGGSNSKEKIVIGKTT